LRTATVRIAAPTSPRAACPRSILVAVALLLAIPIALPAQMAVPIGVRSTFDEQLARPLPDSNDLGPDPDHGKRLMPAVVGGLVGGIALGGIGVATEGGIGVVLVGAMLGTILGSAHGAAIPPGRELCSPSQRLGMGLGGAFLGALPALVFPPIILATAPMGSVMFMKRC